MSNNYFSIFKQKQGKQKQLFQNQKSKLKLWRENTRYNSCIKKPPNIVGICRKDLWILWGSLEFQEFDSKDTSNRDPEAIPWYEGLFNGYPFKQPCFKLLSIFMWFARKLTDLTQKYAVLTRLYHLRIFHYEQNNDIKLKN